MTTITNGQIVINGKPQLILSGEIHYYRLKVEEWEDRIVKAKDADCNAVASYIPWLIHEPKEGEFDLNGKQKPENNLDLFIGLCAKHGLWFIPRPGPFIMAEMKNEGIPYWVYRRHSTAVPVTWKGQTVRSKTLDYLEEGFLSACRNWYAEIVPYLAKHRLDKGGPVIALQLDNEVGMLSWVNNEPDLTEVVLCDFAKFLSTEYDSSQLQLRYGFDVNDPAVRAKKFRDPEETFARSFGKDYGHFNRGRYRRYFERLREFAHEYGAKALPLIINIHGSGGGRGTTFPVGIHHLYEAYSGIENAFPTSDFYLGELTRENAPDLYLINEFTRATTPAEKPLGVMEFECGTGDYGETGAMRQSSASADMKAKLCVAQGNRLINYYLLAGGRNPMLPEAVGDGNDRVAFTGERHGFAAPITPEGELDPTYFGLSSTNKDIRELSQLLSNSKVLYDNIGIAFLPDYYMTDYRIDGRLRSCVEEVESARVYLDSISRSMLWLGYAFKAVNIQDGAIPSDLQVLVVPCCRIMDAVVQQKIVSFLQGGGNVFLYGDPPVEDWDGNECRILVDAARVMVGERRESSSHYHLSVVGKGWAEVEPEVRVWRARGLKAAGFGDVYAQILDTSEACGLEAPVDKGRLTLLSANYPNHLTFFGNLLRRLGARIGLEHDNRQGGVIQLVLEANDGKRILFTMNVDSFDKDVHYTLGGRSLFDGKALKLPSRSASFRVLEGVE